MIIVRIISAVVTIMLVAGFIACVYLSMYLQAILLFLLIESAMIGNQLKRMEDKINIIMTSNYMIYTKEKNNANSANK